MKKQGFILGAVIISIAGFVSKGVGAFYKIPLTNIIGGEGMGLYQMVYPLYCLLLTLSATGIPTAIAKLIATAYANDNVVTANAIFKKSLILFGSIGLIGSLFMFIFSGQISGIQGIDRLSNSYKALSPSVFLVSLMACFRGYFQGQGNMLPTAMSEIVEQLVKSGAGILLAMTLMSKGIELERVMPYILLAVTISEAVGLIFLLIIFLINKQKSKKPALQSKQNKTFGFKQLLMLSIPITFSVILLPLSNITDSIVIVRGLSPYTEHTTTLFGLFSGCALTIISLPVSICYGLAVSIIPLISTLNAKGKTEEAKEKLNLAVKLTALIGVPSSVFILMFSKQILSFVYPNLLEQDFITATKLMQIMWLVPLLLAMVQTLSASMAAMGRAKTCSLVMFIAVVVKTIILVVAIYIFKLSILVAGFATFACYFVALILNLLYSIRGRNLKEILIYLFFLFTLSFFSGVLCLSIKNLNVLIIGIAFMCIYFLLCFACGVFSKIEIPFLRKFKRE